VVRLVAIVALMSWMGTPFVLMIDRAVSSGVVSVPVAKPGLAGHLGVSPVEIVAGVAAPSG